MDHGPRTTDHAPRTTHHAPRTTHHGPQGTPAPAVGGTLNLPPATEPATNYAARVTNRFALRLSNSTASLGQLQQSDTGILLENALLDTAQPVPAIPAHLRAQGDPGTYIVQSRGPLNDAFRALLQSAGATMVSYIPNNAYLVRATQAAAEQLRAAPQAQAVLAHEPYYKLKPSLLELAVAQSPLPADSALNVLLFADASEPTQAALRELGAEIVSGPDRTPFGPVVTVRRTEIPAGQSPAVEPGALVAAIASLPGVQELEWAAPRVPANDLSRVRIGVAPTTLVASNYLGLTGANVLVNVNDSGVDRDHPELTPRVLGSSPRALMDENGHGTHVAGIIASSGLSSTSPVNVGDAAGGSVSGADFRGKAHGAMIFAVPFGMMTGPFASGTTLSWPPDFQLQETPALTNAFISNNSWNYAGPNEFPSYDLHAASYDAAVRDALPHVPGVQPLLIVFSAGNGGGGNSQGTLGNPDSILSPGTAKNVITVGAIEQLREITNIVSKVEGGFTNTSRPWLGSTDSSNLVAGFSSRGNVGVGIEGEGGRFKPDVVAPGTFVVSTRSQQWDTNAYYNPTSHIIYFVQDLLIPTNRLYRNSVLVPENAVQLNLSVVPNTNSPVPFPDMPLYLKQSGPPTNPPPDYDLVGTNHLSLPPDAALNPVGGDWYYGIGNNGPKSVACDFVIDVVVTNEQGDYLDVLAELNDSLGPYYRYESGTSMAAADVSGTLALMQEFFEQRQGRTNSPALMKALVINGARTLGGFYNFNTQPSLNYQGWGLVNLPTTLPPGLTNTTATTNSMVLVDQDPATALATGQSRTYRISLSPAAQIQPLRVTLVWTDPPGNPVASVKLVNDIDLVVSDPNTTNLIYYGNDIGAGSDYTQAWSTNSVPNIDRVNNVENVFLNPAGGIGSQLSANYSITVTGRRVNVNAVAAQTNNVSQDYALVISTGDGLTVGATVTLDSSAPVVSVLQPEVTAITNTFGASPDFSGGILLNQRAGASTQLPGTNTLSLTNNANAVVTLGVTNQWHFYLITNLASQPGCGCLFTNAAFVTFVPLTLSIPRMGVFADPIDNSTRPEADIDLYVAPPTIPNNYALTNLDPVVLAAADKASKRGGTETIVYTNAVEGNYYVGVKAEDQMAAQYAIMGVFSRLPFSSSDNMGNQSLVGIPTFQAIPDGTPANPGYTQIVAIAVQPIMVRRAIVTNTIAHESMTDLLGNLAHSGQFAVLNNHTCVTDPNTSDCYLGYTYIYDDSQEKNVGGAQATDGPGSLRNFAAQEGVGPWIFTMVDNAVNGFGTNIALNIFLEKQQDLTAPGGIIATIEPGACREDFVRLPPNAISLTIEVGVVTATPPIDFTIELCTLDGASCKGVQVTNSVGGTVTIDLTDTPPMLPDTIYTVRICNLAETAITLNIHATIGYSLATLIPTVTTGGGAGQPIRDEAVTDFYLTNDAHNVIASVDLGLLIRDPRVSDLAITLVSPQGTRVLLFENRGAGSTNGLGTFNIITNWAMEPFYTNTFDSAPVGLYTPGARFQDWHVLSNSVGVLDDYSCLCLSNHILALFDGAVSNTLPTTNALPLTNSYAYGLSYRVNHLPWLEGMVSWWPLDADGTDIFGGLNGLLLGNVAFTTGEPTTFFDDFAGPGLDPRWQPSLPNAGAGNDPLIETYVGAPNYSFTTIGTNTVMRMSNRFGPLQRRGWSSATAFRGEHFHYEVRFNTLTQGSGTNIEGLIEIWVLDAANPKRFDTIALFVGSWGATRDLLVGSSIDNTNTIRPFNFQNNTWYRLVISAAANQGVRAALLSDAGVELTGFAFAHGASAFGSGFRIGLSQFVGTPGGPAPVDVAVDSAFLTTTLYGKVNQAYFGDGLATRMIVPRCPELDLGLGRGFSIEGWIHPGNVTNREPLVEWYDPTPPTNQSSLGVQFWLALTNGPGSLGAILWDTNQQPHVITTVTNAITNGGWQHVALTYDTNSGVAALYVNGLTNNQPLVATNLGRFVPRTTGDLYLGYDPSVVPAPINYPDFSSTAGLSLVGQAARSGNVLRLTPATGSANGCAWATNKQSCASGFDTQFQFQFSSFGGSGGGDGLTFAIQNVGPNTAYHFGGMQDGTNSVGVFFNTFYNWPGCTPGPMCEVSGNSVGIVTNSAYLTQVNLGPLGINLKDGAVHQARVTFNGTALTVWLDGIRIFSSVPVPIAAAVDSNGKAWVGFTALTGGAWENHDVLSWTFGSPQTGTTFAGGLDEFSVYDRALTPCEVNAIFNADSRGKYGTNVLVCPVVTEVTLSNSLSGIQTYAFTNGLAWVTNGPHWETNTILFSTGTNPTPIVVRAYDPFATNSTAANNLNAVVDDFVLSEWVPQGFDGLLYFSENTNLATIPIKYAPAPFTTSNFPPVLVFTNDFDNATSRVYQAGSRIPGSLYSPEVGAREWTVADGPVTVVSNAFFDFAGTNYLAMATGAVQCLLPTVPGHRYELNYSLRGPCAVGWWDGTVDPLSRRARDLISGNHGAFLHGATNTATAFVGEEGFFFNGLSKPPLQPAPDLFPGDTDVPSAKIELGDPPQLQFTNAFTIEGWIKPLLPTNATYCGTEQIFYRGYPEPLDCRGLGSPYWLALEPALSAGGTNYNLHFHISDARVGSVGVDVLTTNTPILIGGGSNDGWWHIAAVFDKPFTNITVVTGGTNLVTITTNALLLYVNGICVASNYTTLSPYKDLDPAFSPGASIGGRCRSDWTQPFYGFIDDLTLYARGLTAPELAAIAAAGTYGKADFSTVPPPHNLAKLSVSLEGAQRAVSFGENSHWTTQSLQFTALGTNALLTFQSLLPGTLLGGITLAEVPQELFYFPETSLSAFAGEDTFGIWTLEIWDSRAGPIAATNSELVQWKVNFTLAPSNPPPVITLEHGIFYTNSLPAYGAQYFLVPVPQWATRATNFLQFAEQVHTTVARPVQVFFNSTNFPGLADLPLLGGPPYPDARTLFTNGTPPLTNGQPYYLLLTNPNPVGVTFALEVAFDITTLNICEMLVSNVVGPAGIPRYFQFDVPTNGSLPNLPPQAVAFWLSGAQSNLTVVLSEHLPLPDLNHYDYISDQPSTNDEIVMLVTNTTPFPIQTNRWYAGVFNTTATNVSFNVRACWVTNYPVIIPLANGVPFTSAAPPGPPQWVFYDFLITTPAAGVLFELYNLSGDADLVLQRDVPPTMAPYFDGSFFTGRADEQIVVRNNFALPANSVAPDLRGHWYLGVYNNEQAGVTYTIRAALPDGYGLLQSANPPAIISIVTLAPPHGLLLSWNSVAGERYIVQYAPGITTPMLWTNIGTVLATTPLSTFEVLPVPNGGIYRIVQVYSIRPKLAIQAMPTNVVRLSWSVAFYDFRLQYKLGLFGTWTDLTTTPPAPYPHYPLAVQEGNELAAYDVATNSVPKFYRLIK